MLNKIGKVVSFDHGYGKIATDEDVYTFLDTDTKELIEKGNLVSFQGESINGENRAFFVKLYEDMKNESYGKTYKKD